jgi:transposase
MAHVRQSATLEQWLENGTPRQRKLATIVLERRRGTLIDVIARQVGVHRETVRRWLVRYRRDGLATLKELPRRAAPRIFDDETRAAIQRAAAGAPIGMGAPAARWSLSTLRSHLIRTRVVKRISIERLRYILTEMNGRPRSWREPLPTPICLSADERERLHELCNSPALRHRAAIVLAADQEQPIKAIAVDVGVSESTARRWLRRYHRDGMRALINSQVYREPIVFTSAVRQRIAALAAQSPRALGLSHDCWSLELLRGYLVRQRVVASISKEWLRQIVRREQSDGPRRNASDMHGVLQQFAEHANATRPHRLLAR